VITLVEFLRDRLDEDEQTARAAPPGNWSVWLSTDYPSEFNEQVMADHICRFDRTRVLAEVDAKRRIIDLHGPTADGAQCDWCASLCHSRSGLMCEQPDAPFPCPTLWLLALPFAGHDDWREEWAA
jgi:hypothetical protein